MGIARYYDPDKNPNGAMLPGVPLRDLTDEEFAAQPERIKRSIDAEPMYRKTPLPKAGKKAEKPARVTVNNPPVAGDEQAAPEVNKEATDG